MTREEILEKSRSENKNQDAFDLDVQKKSAAVAVYTAILIAIIMSIVSAIQNHNLCIEVWVVIFGMQTSLFLTKFLKMRKKHELFVALTYAIGFVVSLIYWITLLLK